MTAISEAAEQYSDQLWRLSNLYWIVDKSGKRVRFIPNTSQLNLYTNMWYRNVILKARQRGYTTFINLYCLDSCIFNPDFSAGIIAHNLDDAKKIFRTKVKFPYENLPDGIKQAVSANNDRSSEYIFSNGSSISVSTSYRSGTLQILHVSEMGKIAAKSPEKSQEIITGAFEAVPKEGVIFVESTAEGQGGDFYDITKRAQDLERAGTKLTPFSMKFFFDAWHENPDYVMDDDVDVNSEMAGYFQTLQDNHGITLTDKQKSWYVAKEETQQDKMKREYPSYPEEAFESAINGAIYAKQMARARLEKRICKIPVESSIQVHTFWDLGKRDATAIWFMQQVDKEIRWIDYYENSLEDIDHYCRVIQDKGYLYGKHYMPHDVQVKLLGMVRTRKKQFEQGGVSPIECVPVIPVLIEGIQMVRQAFGSYWFDSERCDKGIKNLDNYKWKWNESTGMYTDQHVHNWASNGCDALRQEAQGFKIEQPYESIPVSTRYIY